MVENIASSEIGNDFFIVLTDESKKKKINELLRAGRAVAFLINENNEIYIGTTGSHVNLISELHSPVIKEKGTISPLLKSINFIYSDHFTSGMTNKERLANQPKIKYEINSFLGTDFI